MENPSQFHERTSAVEMLHQVPPKLEPRNTKKETCAVMMEKLVAPVADKVVQNSPAVVTGTIHFICG